MALRLFVVAAQSAESTGFEEISYDFFVEAFTIYEEAISDSRMQYEMLMLMVGALQWSRVFGDENYENLATKCQQHAIRLLKRPDRCRALANVSHLFWAGERKDGKRVLEILQKALKAADGCLDAIVNAQLFVEMLGQYVYYFEAGNKEVYWYFLTYRLQHNISRD